MQCPICGRHPICLSDLHSIWQCVNCGFTEDGSEFGPSRYAQLIELARCRIVAHAHILLAGQAESMQAAITAHFEGQTCRPAAHLTAEREHAAFLNTPAFAAVAAVAKPPGDYPDAEHAARETVP